MLPAVTDNQVKAIQAGSEFGVTVINEGGQLARYMGRILGTVPEDMVGLVLGDPLHFIRTAIAAMYDDRIGKMLRARRVENVQAVSPSLAIPLLRAAYDENRPELQELWAGLIAAAMDPSRSSRVRQSFIETVKQFDPLDALVLREAYLASDAGALSPNTRDFIANKLQINGTEIILSAANLARQECVAQLNTGASGEFAKFTITTYGRALIRACMD